MLSSYHMFPWRPHPCSNLFWMMMMMMMMRRAWSPPIPGFLCHRRHPHIFLPSCRHLCWALLQVYFLHYEQEGNFLFFFYLLILFIYLMLFIISIIIIIIIIFFFFFFFFFWGGGYREHGIHLMSISLFFAPSLKLYHMFKYHPSSKSEFNWRHLESPESLERGLKSLCVIEPQQEHRKLYVGLHMSIYIKHAIAQLHSSFWTLSGPTRWFKILWSLYS